MVAEGATAVKRRQSWLCSTTRLHGCRWDTRRAYPKGAPGSLAGSANGLHWRALAHGPALLVLDEATSHLDAATEALEDQKLNELACTRIVIAHRPSTIRNADLIPVMDEGMIVERGTHDDLIARDGTYVAPVRHQMPEG